MLPETWKTGGNEEDDADDADVYWIHNLLSSSKCEEIDQDGKAEAEKTNGHAVEDGIEGEEQGRRDLACRFHVPGEKNSLPDQHEKK
jgi:hypothetical protein